MTLPESASHPDRDRLLNMPHLASIHIYPLKGARAVDLSEAAVRPRGLRHDRRWMLVDETGRFLSQREVPAMARIAVQAAGDALTATAPGHEPLHIARPDDEAPRAEVEIWDDTVEAALASDDAHAWFSEVLGRPARLVRMTAASHRAADPRYAVRPSNEVSFADGYPLLLTNQASLDDLKARIAGDAMGAAVPMDRFRPNVVVNGFAAYAEDGWTEIQIGAVRFHVVKPCTRCVVTTIDQATGEAGREPLRTLATYRRVGSKVLFGVNLIPDAPGTVHVGDAVRVLD